MIIMINQKHFIFQMSKSRKIIRRSKMGGKMTAQGLALFIEWRMQFAKGFSQQW